jgi:hypothetical protein
VLNEGTNFIFGLWVYVADGARSFRRHLVDNTKQEAYAASQRSGLDETLLSDLGKEIEEESVFNAT